MYQLARVQCVSVGPVEARLDPLRLDFRTPDGRISSESVLLLTNGGGKTVLMRLLFAVLRPDKMHQIGSEEAGRVQTLQAFVGEGDTAHVILEWRRVMEPFNPLPDVLITGLVAEWRNRARSTESSHLQKCWYSIRSQDGTVTLDDLPAVQQEGRRLTRAMYLECLRDFAKRFSSRARSCDLKVVDTQTGWFSHLTDLGLDPALFGYQVDMNRDEAGAAKLLRFPSALHFIEFFLNAVTEPETLSAMDHNLDELAQKVAAVPLHELELQFATGAIGRLETLMAARDTHEAAQGALQATGQDVIALRNQFHTTAQQAMAQAGEAKDRQERETSTAQDLERRVRELDDERKEYERRVAVFGLKEAEVEMEAARVALEQAKLKTEAWQEADAVVALQKAEAQVKAAKEAYDAAEQQASGLKEQRDDAARRLRRRLTAEQLIQRAEAERQHRMMLALRQQAAEHQKVANDAEMEARSADLYHQEWQRKVDLRYTLRASAIREGILAESETAEVAMSCVQARHAELGQELARLQARREEIRRSLIELEKRREHLDSERMTMTFQLQQVTAQYEQGQTQRRKLAEESRLQALAEDAGFDIELIGLALATRLNTSADAAERRVIDLEVQATGDRRATEHLEHKGLLPAPLEVEKTLDHLRRAGIKGTIGWEYLAQSVAREQQAFVLARRPDLVSGVVLHRPEDLSRAEDLLRELGLDPAMAIVVGPVTELTEAETDGPPRVLVPPAQALYDTEAASEELTRRRERLSTVDEEKAALISATHADRELARRLREHLDAYPLGRLAGLVRTIEVLNDRLTQVETELQDTKRQSQALSQEEKAGGTRERICHEERGDCDRQLFRLSRIQEAELAAEGAEEQIEKLVRQEQEWRGVAEAERARAEEAQRWADEAVARETERATAVELVAEERQRVLVERTQDEMAAELAPQIAKDLGSLDTLREIFAQLDNLLAERTTRSAVAQQLEEALKLREQSRGAVGRIRLPVRLEAERLLALPDSLTEASRRLARERAGIARDHAIEIETETRRRVKDAKAEVARVSPSDQRDEFVRLRPKRVPPDRTTAQIFAAETAVALQNAKIEREAATTAAREAERVHAAARQKSELMNGFLGACKNLLLTASIPDVGAIVTEIFQGDASSAMEALNAQLLHRAEETKKAEQIQCDAIDAVKVFARGEPFMSLPGQLRQRLALDTDEVMVQHCATLLRDVRILASQLQSELTSLQQHRKLVVQTLVGLTSQALANLANAERQSKLPKGEWSWSDKPFLKIKFESPTELELENRLDPFVADIAHLEAKNRPTGVSLLVKAMETTVTGGFTVRVLKPNQAGHSTYVSIDQSDIATLSGGMRATAAIALFCTLAGVRMHIRGRSRDIGVATLCLDNPLGNANAPYLVDLQLTVARAAGIQLIFTTGIKDYDALKPFRNVIALSNDAARRTTLRYVRTDPRLWEALAPAMGPGGRVTVTRVVSKAPMVDSA